MEKAEISAKEQTLKENLSQVQKERMQLEVEMNERLDLIFFQKDLSKEERKKDPNKCCAR